MASCTTVDIRAKVARTGVGRTLRVIASTGPLGLSGNAARVGFAPDVGACSCKQQSQPGQYP
jgi:hypothetical protein